MMANDQDAVTSVGGVRGSRSRGGAANNDDGHSNGDAD
jgi:hypothetical protein